MNTVNEEDDNNDDDIEKYSYDDENYNDFNS